MSWGYKDTPGRAECMDHKQREAPVMVPATTPLPDPAFFLQPVGQIWVVGGPTDGLIALGLGGIVEVMAGGR